MEYTALRMKQKRGVIVFLGVILSFSSITLILVQKQKDKFPVQQSLLNSHPDARPCTPSNKIAFVKVHKAGSSTVANILQRFGYIRKLNFVIPRKEIHEFGYNYIGYRGDTVTRYNILPPPPGQSFHILWNHVTYDHDAFREIMPIDTRYITILREPFDQFVSAFEYYYLSGNRSNIYYKNKNPISEFLSLKNNVVNTEYIKKYALNSQSFDMGFKKNNLNDALYRQDYLRMLSEDFDLVMLLEYFDESLVLLKRTMCWTLLDILYLTKNKNSWKARRLFKKDDYDAHKRLSVEDYHLYDYFRKIFWDKIWKEGPDFFEEVHYFKDIVSKLDNYCSTGSILVVPSSKWGQGFTVSRQICMYLQYAELLFYDKIVKEANDKTFRQHQQFPYQ